MKTAETSKTIVLGSEYDQKLREALLATLDELAGRAVNRSWGVGGSQEIEQLDVAIGNETIVVEAEDVHWSDDPWRFGARGSYRGPRERAHVIGDGVTWRRRTHSADVAVED